MNMAAPRAEAQAPRLLICSAGIPHPSQGASIVLFFHYIDCLRRAGYRILHLLLLEGDGWPQTAVDDYRQRVEKSSSFDIVIVRAPHFVTQGRVSHKLRLDVLGEALQKIRDFRPDAAIAFDIVPAWVAAQVPAGRRLVWLGDLHFQTMWLHAKYAARENPRAVAGLPTGWLVSRAWRDVYARVLRGVDQIIASSASSVAKLAALGLRAEYEPYPWPDSSAAPLTRTSASQPSFLFFGNLVGLGSRSALHFTVEQLYPRLCRLWPGGFRIYIAGRGALPEWFEQAIAGKPEFVKLGFVPDLDALMAQCHAVLAPIDVPVGNRSRILTAMARGALVVAHQNASLGNPDLVDGETCYLARDAEGFVKRMQRAVEDETAAQAIVARARRCYMDRFHPEPAGRVLLRRVDALTGKPVHGDAYPKMVQ